MQTNQHQRIIVAGATGALGNQIVYFLLRSGAKITALVRKGNNADAVASLKNENVTIAEVDYNNIHELVKACKGGICIVSALSGVEDVIVGVQQKLLLAAVEAGVPRFIPSDYCIDYTKLAYGTNRNIDLRRRFNEILDKSSVAATSVLNGMFTDLLTGQAPVVLFPVKRILYWGNKNQLLDFTSMANTAEFTAKAALDNSTPRYLRIAGDVINPIGLKAAASEATGKKFHLFRAGSLGLLKNMIKITRTLFPKKNEVFPPWQGMQYLHNMFTGLPKLTPLNNDRYPDISWTSVQEVLRTNTNKK